MRFKKLYKYLGIKIQDESITPTSASVWNEGKDGRSPWKQKTLEIKSVAMVTSEFKTLFPNSVKLYLTKNIRPKQDGISRKKGLLET